MRIACIHVPQLSLQCATRLDPSLRGAPVAVVGAAGPERTGVLHAPVVLACSRAAFAVGVRVGMTATAARGLSGELQIVTADAANERETVRAIADTLLAVSPVVDLGGRVGAGGAHLAMYVEVPAKTRGASFGERLLELIDELGLTARIGIADDRFTAWVAAAHGGIDERAQAPHHVERGVVSVPRGGSAAFLAPRPLSLLNISPEVQHMLEALGVRTLGEFAALPAPSVARPFEADYQALARGESDALLRPYTPEAPVREEIVISAGNVLELQDLLPAGEHAGGLSVAGAIALVARRVALRLAGRGRSAARLELVALDRAGSVAREAPVTLEHPLGPEHVDELVHVITPALATANEEHARAHDIWRLRVVVIGEALAGAEMHDVFGRAEGEAHEVFAEGSARIARDQLLPDHPGAQTISPLHVVLSSAGSLFALSPPTLRSERREAHRRMRRGKQRRARPTPQAQPRLFDRTSSK